MAEQITSQQQDGESTADWQQREADASKYLDLCARLDEERYMILWLCNVHRNSVSYPNSDADTLQKIQQQLPKASNLISIAYTWTLLEGGGFDPEEKWVPEDQRLEVRAWQHVRDTCAGPPGVRAAACYDAFDQYMTGSSEAISGLRQNCQWDASSIELAEGMNLNFFIFAQNVVRQAYECAAGNRAP